MSGTTTHNIAGVEYQVRPPLGRDWLAVSGLDDVQRSIELIRACVTVDGAAAFATRDDVEAAPMATLLELDRAVGALMEYPVPDPTSGEYARSPSSSDAA